MDKTKKLIEEMAEEQDALTTYFDKLPSDKQRSITNRLNRMRTGLYTVAPLKCRGPEVCPFISHCPIPVINSDGEMDHGPQHLYPVGLDCILEHGYMKNKVMDYYLHLEVDPQNPVEVALVNELAILDLYKNRALMVMSNGDAQGQGMDLLKRDTIGYTDSGHEITATVLHPVVEALDKFEKRRQTLLRSLNETRKDKVEINARLGLDGQSPLLEEMAKIRKALEQASAKEIELVDEELIPIK